LNEQEAVKAGSLLLFKYVLNEGLVKKISVIILGIVFLWGCKKDSSAKPPVAAAPFEYVQTTVNGNIYESTSLFNVSANPVIRVTFSQPINQSTVTAAVSFTGGSATVASNYSYPTDSSLVIQPSSPLKYLTSYSITVSTALKSAADSSLTSSVNINFITGIDSTDKFPRITDSALLTLVEQQTFNYFWSGADANSGMAKERTSQTQVTTGGSGFGIMAMLVGVQRDFISRTDAFNRITTIVNFLTNSVTTYHGAFSHWINGSTGATIPFGTEDNGGDIVETS
jgi:hypothetical protein